MVVTLCAVLNPETCLLHIVVWGMTSWGRSQKKGMIIYYQCDCTLNAQLLLQSPKPKLTQLDFLRQSLLVAHLTLNVALAFQFAFGLHPLLTRDTSLFPYFQFSLWRWSCRPKVIGPVTRDCCALSIGSTGRYKYDSFTEQNVAGLLALSF